MGNYYLAIDIGASSGRAILGNVKDGRIQLEEVYRFKNELVTKNGQLCWDLDALYSEILNGLKRCKELGKIPSTVGIDTWAVDFVLLDGNDRIIGDTVGYRDTRTSGMDKAVYDIIPARRLYEKTGIQMQIFNTIYQLTSLQLKHKEQLARAKSFLMIPDYFNFLLTGKKLNEYTNATTTQLVNVQTKQWDKELIVSLGINAEIFKPLSMPKTVVGELKPDVRQAVGFNCEVVLPATHDTGSAVLSVPANDNDYIYLSSGTWSLIGTERPSADCSEESFQNNFTNEGGFDYRFRYLKNIMGLWIIQSVKRELGGQYSFDNLCELAMQASDFKTEINVNDNCFLSPVSMTRAIKEYCVRTGRKAPVTTGELMACVYNSLAGSYADAVNEIERLTGKTYKRLHIVGGGSKDDYLNRLTASYTGKEVYAGPTEATAIGNLLAQMLQKGEFASLEQARNAVAASFNIKKIGD
jgi:rhamnulokinase